MKTSFKNKQNWKFRSKKIRKLDDESDSAQEVFTFSLFSNYENYIPNQSISSIKKKHVTKTKIYQPIENENVNSIQLKHESLTINKISVKLLIDTGSSIDIIEKNIFDRVQSKGQKIRLFKKKKELYPYASDPIEMLGYF